MRTFFILAFLMLMAACGSVERHSTQHGNHHKKHESTPQVYVYSEQPMADVQAGLSRAQTNNKHLLLVLGAQWCHDSRGLAERLTSPELKHIVADHYETVFIDVSYLRDLRNITNRFGQAHYFATPAVMVINPDTGQLLNAADLAIWGAADSVSLADYQAYFTRYAKVNSLVSPQLSAEHQEVIHTFERQQSDRLQAAYDYLSPGLQAKVTGSDEGESVMQSWYEVRDYRLQLQKDIQHLYQLAQQQPDKPLILPTYPPFSWQ